MVSYSEALKPLHPDAVRKIVREEILALLETFGRAADYEGRSTESEIGERAASTIENVVEATLRRMTCEHEYRSYQPNKCWRCDEPAPVKALDPFCDHAMTNNDDGTRTCQLCEGVKSDG